MDITDLIAGSDSDKLIEFANKLKELSEKENELMNKSNELIEKGDKVTRNKSDLNIKSTNYISLEDGKVKVNINNSIDSDEFINIVTKSNDYKSEKEEIEKEAVLICKELEKVNEERTKIKEKIDELLSYSSENNIGIDVKSVGTMHIIDSKPISEGNTVSDDLCEIINCSRPFVNDIYDTYKRNVTDIALENDLDSFTKLKAYTSNYNFDKNKEYEAQLELLNKVEENSEQEVIDSKEEIENEQKETLEDNSVTEEKINIEIPKIELPIVEEETIEPKLIKEQKEEPEEELSVEDNVQSKEEVISESIIEPKEEKVAVIKDPVTLEVISEVREDGSKVENDNILPLSDIMKKEMYIKDKLEKDKVATTNKEKYNGKIFDIWDGSYPSTKFKKVESVNEVKVDDNFNMDNFVSNVAA